MPIIVMVSIAIWIIAGAIVLNELLNYFGNQTKPTIFSQVRSRAGCLFWSPSILGLVITLLMLGGLIPTDPGYEIGFFLIGLTIQATIMVVWWLILLIRNR